ncbi:MAG: NAD(P)-dependent glycerol-3-phosphate dehydrogenase [Candidatus Omnitrophica bacterium]|nr:NAD(P)-dependent glycerol-3-phosphate dehydrogenase [Candidatus Omnitrophota bacterium]MDD5441695.1 NAD(P)-dependent glycerol-3-phosphate dehydrogenase [Candidatus Omnitrophota bacterium]
MKQKISVIGDGAWGTTMAISLALKGLDVRLHSVFDENNIVMSKSRRNDKFLSGAVFPENLSIEQALSDALDADIIVFAVPVKFARSVLRKMNKTKKFKTTQTIVSLSKGIEISTQKTVSQIISDELKNITIAILSGPNIAREVLNGVPSVSVIACANKKRAQVLQEIFATDMFRIYYTNDVIGVEIAGALKNVIAIACGVSDGLGFGVNTKSAIVTRGLVEILRLGKKLKARPETFWGLSGLGDLTTTCFSPLSRNRTLGEKLGKGAKLKDLLSETSSIAEGIYTVKAARKIAKKLGIELPITEQIYKLLYSQKPARQAVASLMGRPLKAERI